MTTQSRFLNIKQKFEIGIFRLDNNIIPLLFNTFKYKIYFWLLTKISIVSFLINQNNIIIY